MSNTNIVSNITNAKISTHSIVIVAVFMGIIAKHFFDDPNAVKWLDSHWYWKDLIEGIQFALPAVAAYINPVKGETKNV